MVIQSFQRVDIWIQTSHGISYRTVFYRHCHIYPLIVTTKSMYLTNPFIRMWIHDYFQKR